MPPEQPAAPPPPPPGLREDLAGTLGWEKGLRETLRDLLLHPVRIVSSYMDGNRGRYVPPVKTYFALGALYMLGVSVVQPYSFRKEVLALPAGGPSQLHEQMRARGLTPEKYADRVDGRMNTITPATIALALLPVLVPLRLMDRRRSWRQHLRFLLGISNVAWLLGLLVLPVALIHEGAHAALVGLVCIGAYALLFWNLYPGRTALRTALRFAVFLAVDLAAGVALMSFALLIVMVVSIFF